MTMRRFTDEPAAPTAGTATFDAEAPSSASIATARAINAMTVDVEEYFQVSAFAPTIAPSAWDSMPSRVEDSVDRLLALFAAHGARCTFFTLGWIAERHPAMIRRMVAAGHELASHGYSHRRVTELAPAEFRTDVKRTKAILEDVGGVPVAGFRAASFSFDDRTRWAHEILAEEGYRYSSSVYPVRHDHYGVPDAPRFAYRPSGENGVPEFPMTTVRLLGHNLPCAGGGYFRLLPCALFRWAIRRVNARDAQPAIFYFHPWEIDAGQPRPAGISARTRFRHYVNLGRTEAKLRLLLTEFAWDRMDRVMERSLRTSP
jgi:polysaccharide deacetylase family protein (PEP-CTERM system associated)